MATDNIVRVLFEAVTDKFKAQVYEITGSVTGLGEEGRKAEKELEFKDSKKGVDSFTGGVKNAETNTKELGEEGKKTGNKLNNGFKEAKSGAEKLNNTLNNMIKMLVAGFVANQIKKFFSTAVTEIGKTQTALGALKSLGVEDLEAVRQAAINFSNTWSGTTREDFISASYAIKSGIASLTDEGVAKFTEMAALTAKATKATANEMTNLYAQGYGIYRNQFGSDNEFAEKFSSGISKTIQLYRTSGTEMSSYISSLGAAAEKAGRPLSEILAVGGELQNTMSGSEAATKYQAFVKGVTKAGDDLKLSFLDANNRIKSTTEILDVIRAKYGNTLDALEVQELTEAFGRKEAVDFIQQLYDKTGDVVRKTDELRQAMSRGAEATKEMAEAMNEGIAEKSERLKQRISNIFDEIGRRIQSRLSGAFDKVFNAMDEFVSNGSLDKMADSVARIIDLFANWFNNFLQKAPDMLDKFANGLAWVADNIYGIAKALSVVSGLMGAANVIGGIAMITAGIAQITTGVGIPTGIATIVKGVSMLGAGAATAFVSKVAFNQVNSLEKQAKADKGIKKTETDGELNRTDNSLSPDNKVGGNYIGDKEPTAASFSSKDNRTAFEKALDDLYEKYTTKEDLINSQITLEDIRGNDKAKKTAQSRLKDLFNDKLASLLKLDNLTKSDDERNILEAAKNKILTEIVRITNDIKGGVDKLIGSFNTPSEFTALTQYAYNTNNNSILTRVISTPKLEMYLTVKDLGANSAAEAKNKMNSFADSFMKDNIVFDGMSDVVKN